MAEPVAFVGANQVFRAPQAREDICDLPTFTNGKAVVSAWKLTAQEIDEVNRTGTVFLSVLCGRNFFPVFVGSEPVVKSVVLDSGPAW